MYLALGLLRKQMANALPILLLGGAALLMMGSKKKNGASKNEDAADANADAASNLAASGPLLATKVPPKAKQFLAKKSTFVPKSPSDKAAEDSGSTTGSTKEHKTWVEEHAAILCAQPQNDIAAQAKIYAAIATEGMREASGRKLKKRRAEFPCEYKNRVSWTVDEAFRLWVLGNPKAKTSAKFYITTGAWLGKKAEKHRPWNTMVVPEQSNRSLTGLSYAGGMRLVTDLDLSPCARHIRNLLTEEIRKKCGKERGGLKKILPWNW